MKEKKVVIGMIGAGRATQLHMDAYKRVVGILPAYKTIVTTSMEKAEKARATYGFRFASDNFEDILNDNEIEVVDICTPPYVHREMIIKALRAGKHVICEKPIDGFFGTDDALVGKEISKRVMFESLLESLNQIREAIEHSGKKFMYAENFIYAPAIQKMAEIISKKKSRVLCLKGEESLKGSSSHVAGLWNRTGGGTLIRTGTHPLSAALWLKHVESDARNVNIIPISVVADMGFITNELTEYEHRHIAARPIDVEDFGTCIVSFSDKTKAIIIATDTLLGGSKNYLEAYCNDAVLYSTLTLNNLMNSYFLDEEGLDDVYISEMLPQKTGWNNPFIVDEIIRGYTAEMQDFMEAVAYDREPISGFKLAYETSKIIYAAYLSSEEGRRILL